MAKPRTRDEIAAAFGEQPKRSRADIENAFNVPRQGAPRLTVTLPGGRVLETDLPEAPARIGDLGAALLADNRPRVPDVGPADEVRRAARSLERPSVRNDLGTLGRAEAVTPSANAAVTLGDRAQDVQLSFQAGGNRVIGGLESLPNLPHNLAGAWTQGANSILGQDVFVNDVPRFAAADEASARRAERAEQLQNRMSTRSQLESQEYSAEELGGQIKYVMTHPGFTTNVFAENAPQFATLFVPGGVGTKLAASGLLGTGMMQDQIARDNMERVERGEITQQQADAAAGLGGAVSGAQNVLLPRVLGRFGGLTLERAAAGLRPTAALGSRSSAIAQGLLGEGAQGFGTEYADQLIQNSATGRPLTEGATGSAVLGALMEGPLGGLVAGVGHRTAYDVLRDPNATAGEKYEALQWVNQHGTNADKSSLVASAGTVIAPDVAQSAPSAPLEDLGTSANTITVPARPAGAFTAAVQAARDHAAVTAQVTQEQAQEAAQAAQDAVATQSEPEAVGAAIRAAQETQQTAQQAAQIAGLADADILDHLAGLLDEEPNGQTDAVEGGEIAGANPAESGAVAPVVPVDVDQAQVSTAASANPAVSPETRASATSQAASLQAVPQDAAPATTDSAEIGSKSVANPTVPRAEPAAPNSQTAQAQAVAEQSGGEALSNGIKTAVYSRPDTAGRDAEYRDAVERGDMESAQRMVNEAAEQAGYQADSDHRMSHRAPNSEDDVSLADVRTSGLVPDDYWTHPQWYTTGPHERSAMSELQALFRRMDAREANGRTPGGASIIVYRAVPKSVKEGAIRNGDWVSPSEDYARDEGASIPGGYRIISQLVSAKNLWWDGNSAAELGYDNGKGYAYRNTKNNRKLLDAVTRDDDGNIIPLSRRFQARNSDERFSRPDQSGPRFLTQAADVQAAVRQVLDGWKGDKPVVRVVQTVAEARKQGAKLPADAPNDAEGWWDGGSTVYIVAENNRDVARALEVLSHEAIGHYGIEKVLGKEAWARLVADVKRLRGLKQSDVSPKIWQVLQSAKRRYGQENDTVFAKEFLAIMSEQGVRTGLTSRVVAKIRQFLAKIGIPVNISKTFREAELLAALHAGRQRVTQGERGARHPSDRQPARATQRRMTGDIMFSRVPNDVLADVRAQMDETEARVGGLAAYEASGSKLPYPVWIGSQTPAYRAFVKNAKNTPQFDETPQKQAKDSSDDAKKPQDVAIDDVTGIAHEYSQKYMREIGEDEITKGIPQAWQQQLAAALTEYMGKGDPEQRYAYGQEVVESILDGQPPSSHTEALLSVYLRDLKNRQIDLESRPESDILAQAELAQNQQRQMAIHIAMFKGGSALGRALNIRRMLLKKDFSYEALVRRELSRNGGKALDKATQDKLREMADTIAKQTKRLEELEAALADKAAAAAFAHARRRSASRARADREWEDRAAAARRRIASAEGVKSRNKQAGAVMSPALLYDYATLGAYHVRKGAVALADMIAAIRTDIGSVIDEWLDDMPRIHALAKKLAQGNKETPSDVAADIKDREPTAADVLRMMRALAAAGVVSHVEAIEQASKLLKMDNATVRQMLIDGTPSAHTRSETAQIVSDIRKAARLESEIERLEAQRPKQVKPRTVRKDSPEVAAKREELRALKQSLRERGEDVDFNAQQERHYERRAAYWQNRIDTGDYNDTPKVPRAIANAVAQARLRSIEAQNAFIEWQYEQSLKDMTRTQRAMHRAFNLLQMPRAIQSSSDLSALGRQGLLLGLGHPVVFAKAAWDTIGAAFSQAKYEAIHHDIRENPAYANAVIDGVEFTDLNAGSLTRREEIFASRLLAKIPVYFGGGVLRGSQRQYTAFLNVLRLNAYTSMMANQDRGAGKALAGVVNAFSGRGNISNQKLANMMVGASTVFYAPRFAVSRLQTVVGQPIWRSEARGYRAVVAKEYGRMFLGMSAYMALLALAVAGMRDDDDDSPLITFDWRSSDFSKFRMGGVRLDPLAGLAQWVTLIGRQVTGETETDGKVSPLTTGGTLRDLEIWLGMDVPPHKMGKDGKLAFGSRNGANIIQDFLRSKLAPIPGAYLNWRAGETPGGDKTNLQTELLGLVHPLSYGDIVDGFRADTSNMQRAGIAAASIFGIGVQARSSQDDAQLARFNQRVQQARDDVRTRLMALPMDQWESALEAMRPEYGPLLDGTTLQIYQRDGKYGYAGEPARDDQGRPKLKNTRLATDYRDAANAAPGEEVNHIIPDNLVRHHPLMARAREFGFDLDAPENLLAMPRDPEPGRVAHHGDHKHYDAQVYKELQRAQRRLKNRFDSLDAAPPQDVLREIRRVQDDMRKRLESGDVPTKDGRLVMRDNQTNTRVA